MSIKRFFRLLSFEDEGRTQLIRYLTYAAAIMSRDPWFPSPKLFVRGAPRLWLTVYMIHKKLK